MRPLAAVVAMNDARVIGMGNALPWHIPEDLKHFRRITTGHAILMGRRTHESIGRCLPKRTNIVLSRSTEAIAEGAVRAQSLDEALSLCAEDPLPMVIGGAQIYELAMPRLTELYITRVHRDVQGDVFFPSFDPEAFQERSRRAAEDHDDVEFVHLMRREPMSPLRGGDHGA